MATIPDWKHLTCLNGILSNDFHGSSVKAGVMPSEALNAR
jgi:hypothetical protein